MVVERTREMELEFASTKKPTSHAMMRSMRAGNSGPAEFERT